MPTPGGTPLTAPPDLIAGRYRVGEVLGQGGMGEVRAGHDERLGREVAIKILRPELAAQLTIRRRFEDEAKAAARLVHPHVVAVFDTGEDGDLPYLVMERLSGLTLADEISSGPLSWQAVQVLGDQVLQAVAAAHAAGFIHRDIKPGNILVGGPGTWKVGDFGIAKSLETTDPTLTSTGMILGTPAYLPPERLLGGPATTSSDIYAAGVVLYEALAQQRPFDAAGPNANALSATPTPLAELRPDTPAGFIDVIMRAMSPDPAVRYPSAAEMAAALAAWGPPGGTDTPPEDIVPLPLPAGPIGDAPPTTVVSAEGAQHTLVLPAEPEPARVGDAVPLPATPARRRHSQRKAAIALAVGTVAVVVIIGLSGSQHPASTSPAPAASPAPATGQGAPTLPAPLASALANLHQQVQP